ncbi:MAG: hypothetical protein R3263_12120, partial [Myxococcota bacterium]|nr:hypothetical protein [Myxococcota bacterium]
MGERSAAPIPPEAVTGRVSRSADEADLQTLLSRTVQELVERTGATRAVAWRTDRHGRPGVWAASVEGAVLREPDREAWEALAA